MKENGTVMAGGDDGAGEGRDELEKSRDDPWWRRCGLSEGYRCGSEKRK